ncbi:ABC transporter ATP-binding protein [Paenibacillus donghaensis]|uniref:ABC transporter ATP-binding protein n=1 Tax=Paenibacillus donghaensis TaxID=414771 RepID=A0A2Z2KI46_9BACL|nr:ABC transporter ATP-binding protein [Paenibacillus donghaensis]ASA19471.1 hypothetical protein B9T62_00545 [Paenibacillus donghaensis]
MKDANKMHGILFLISRLMPVTIKIIPGLLSVSLIILLIQALIPLVQVQVTLHLVNSIQQLVEGSTQFSTSLIWLSIQGGVGLLTASTLMWDQLLKKKMLFQVSFFFEKKVLEKSQKLSLIHYEIPQSYDLLAQTNGAGERGFQVLSSIGIIFMYCITMVGYLATLAKYSWLLPLLIILLIIPVVIFNIKLGGKRYEQMIFQSPDSRKATYITQLFKGRDSIKEIKMYGTGEYLLNKWSSIYWVQANEKYSLEKKAGWINFKLEALGVVSILVASAMLIFIVSKESLSLGEYVALTAVITSSYAMSKTIASNFSRIFEDALFATKIFSFLDLPEENKDHQLKMFPEKLVKGLEVRDLTFNYPGQNRPVLKNVSFTIGVGERVAIVGYNGAGKSTLIKCIMGLYPVPRGMIFFDGVDINDFDRSTLYENVTAIFQDFVKYNLTLRENVAFGNLHKLNDDFALSEATSKAEVFSFIDRLDHKYETELGPLFSGGQDISGGQWQKIAISRAFLRNSQIVIFDEATSALDPVSEYFLLEKIINMTEGKTTIFISHRLNSCRMADSILVLQDGEVVESGGHQQLLNLRGYYADMFEKQSSGYVGAV